MPRLSQIHTHNWWQEVRQQGRPPSWQDNRRHGGLLSEISHLHFRSNHVWWTRHIVHTVHTVHIVHDGQLYILYMMYVQYILYIQYSTYCMVPMRIFFGILGVQFLPNLAFWCNLFLAMEQMGNCNLCVGMARVHCACNLGHCVDTVTPRLYLPPPNLRHFPLG